MRIACFSGAFTWRGAHRVLSTLASGFAARGHDVTYITTASGDLLHQTIVGNVHAIDLGTGSVLKALPALRRYLVEHQPEILLSATEHVNVIAGLAALTTRTGTRVFASCHNVVNPPGEQVSLQLRILHRLMGAIYPRLNGVIAVSDGVADSLNQIGLSRERIGVIYNPVVTPLFQSQRLQRASHPFLEDRSRPIIVAAGSLTRQKGFDVLLAALARLPKTIPARLIILGDGPDRDALYAQARTLGISSSVSLPGYVPNAPAFMEAADLFVLSSRYEGFGLVLAEALAVGTPVVSTDCRSGPREILENGKYGQLAEVNNPDALAEAIVDALEAEHDRQLLTERGASFSLDTAVDKYLDLFETAQSKAAA